ncbi:MAG: hypothetical protein LBW77_05460, partial [Verrucomicrobiota bacterium]|nr:hypothetical protein [Verrucomicrobiota bacterium]
LAFAASAGTAPFTGALTVQAGAFAVRGVTGPVAADIPCPSFESTPLLPETGQSGMDKRGTAATNCVGWTFVNQAGDARDAGYQRNESYWSTQQDVKTTNGVQTAFIRRDAFMFCSFTMPQAGQGCTLRFEYAPRFYGGVCYTNGTITVKVDGAAVDILTVTEPRFLLREVQLGDLSAGAHTLEFLGGYPGGGEPATLIDAVRIDGMTPAGSAAAWSSETSVLTLAAGVTVALDFEGVVDIGSLFIGGVRYRGGYYGAVSYPGVFSGPGRLHIKDRGSLLILK